MRLVNVLTICACFCILFANGCGQKNETAQQEMSMPQASTPQGEPLSEVQAGAMVTVDYIGTYNNGELFDSSIKEEAEKAGIMSPQRNYQPLKVTIGQRGVIPGFEKGLMGMKVGETKDISILPADAYGQPDPKRVRNVPMSMFQQSGMEPKEGETLNMPGPGGRMVPVKVHSVGKDSVLLDMNHPMAGDTLNFKLTVRDIRKAGQ